MKKALYTSVAFVLLAGSSLAADLTNSAIDAPEIVDTKSFDWSGFYLGISGGALGSNASAELESVGGVIMEADVENGVFSESVSGSGIGGILGVQAGYNAQFGNFVLGAEADVSWAQLDATAEHSAIDPGTIWTPMFAGRETVSSYRTSVDGLATLRARVGVTADGALFYVTGGLAAGNVENEFGIEVPSLPVAFGPWSDNGVLWGVAAGIGVEYAVSDNITAKLEYLHYDLADRTVRATDEVSFPGQHLSYRFLNSGDVIRGGINFKF